MPSIQRDIICRTFLARSMLTTVLLAIIVAACDGLIEGSVAVVQQGMDILLEPLGGAAP